MKFPEKIRVERIEDYHTHYIGKYNGENQFLGDQTFVFKNNRIPEDDNWEKYRREYIVIYLFDKVGNFLGIEYQFAGTTDSIQFDMGSKLEEMVGELGEIEFCNIEVKPFQIEIDGSLFGLIPNKESEMIELQPSNTIAFGEPWDGDYNT
ncbi:MAG: hypothetical protein AB8F94_12555 [Saprospiraceae bacterium]